jgi:hypothetical protein
MPCTLTAEFFPIFCHIATQEKSIAGTVTEEQQQTNTLSQKKLTWLFWHSRFSVKNCQEKRQKTQNQTLIATTITFTNFPTSSLLAGHFFIGCHNKRTRTKPCNPAMKNQ